ncbi:two-component sensor histidine kinase [Clostridium sp. W14A]|uniref:histidine kinase n=1 Tax=Caproicibacter fermentans TaxID=2576756 RepID=A0A7G8TGE6_9FIRM|nr:HAMP domain-containing sensor histidine kinase [Caproicibacter fermentans]OCN01968.1 two-component sensor histidine kinase [Clostridium sp. W14A]QNK42687.1 HAMP domain-containing histidine kinase [Caproicibacter fermentans]
MKILANKRIKALFSRILMCILVFAVVAAVFMNVTAQNTAVSIYLSSLCMAVAILIFCYAYFKEQHVIIETAAEQITDYIAGDPDARIQCDEEGELYRLFQEVNSLVSILNAHAENELRAKEFLKNTIADISHQLKTPLAALNVYNGILQGEAGNSQTIQKFTGLSEQELERIETLVQNLLKIAKLDAGTIVIEKAEENVSEMMGGIERHFAFRAMQEEKKMVLSGDEDISLMCDRNWLIEAIGNIVKNAFDHTQKGNEIDIEWKQFASVIQVIIKDDGSGIHPEDLHHIFKRFYRSRFSKDAQGVGLGLPLAKAVIEAHNGTIEVDSELGIGTAFTINFLIPTKL